MKHSSFKYPIFFSVILLICFGIGFSIGAFPKQWKFLKGDDTSDLHLLFSDPNLIPKELIFSFEKISGIHVVVDVKTSLPIFQSEAHNADLLFAPLEWVDTLKPLLHPLEKISPLKEQLFSDFQSSRLEPDIFLPMFWKVENEGLISFYGFLTAQNSKNLHKDAQFFLKYVFEKKSNIEHWATQIQMATTLKSDSKSILPDFLKAQKIRSHNLSAIQIKRSTEDIPKLPPATPAKTPAKKSLKSKEAKPTL